MSQVILTLSILFTQLKVNYNKCIIESVMPLRCDKCYGPFDPYHMNIVVNSYTLPNSYVIHPLFHSIHTLSYVFQLCTSYPFHLHVHPLPHAFMIRSLSTTPVSVQISQRVQ